MKTIRVSAERSRARGIDVLSSACNHLLANYVSRGEWFTSINGPEDGFNLMFDMAKLLREESAAAKTKAIREKLIAVYRFNQPAMISKCVMGEPCEVCAPHRECRTSFLRACNPCRRGRLPNCPFARPAPPAFTVIRSRAVKMVELGFASFVDMGRALRLTFSRVTGMRGMSLRIDEKFLMDYACGRKSAVETMEAVGIGWTTQQTASANIGAFCHWPMALKWNGATNEVTPT